jgi:hypothetical protein
LIARLVDVPPPPGPIGSRPVRAGDGTALGLLAYAAYRGSVDDNGEHEAWHVADLTSALEDEYGPDAGEQVPAGDALPRRPSPGGTTCRRWPSPPTPDHRGRPPA